MCGLKMKFCLYGPLGKNWVILDIDINVFVGDLYTLSLQIYTNYERVHTVATVGGILKFESK